MKILFLYTKLDKNLKQRVAQLIEHNADVSLLSLLEYKLEEAGEITYMEPPSKLEFLEKNSGKLRLLNRIFKRKKLLNQLQDYDIIDLYKCEKSALFIVDEIREKCYDYFVTVGETQEENNLLNKPFYKYLYEKARFLLFDNQTKMLDFPYPNEEKSRFIPPALPLLKEIASISEEEIFKASYAMGFDMEKDIVYVDMSGALSRQLRLIDDLLHLPEARLRECTFIFHLNRHSLDERRELKAYMQEKNFDYLLIEAFITPKQEALLYKIADKSIILSDDPLTHTLALSLYAKHHLFLYHDTKIDRLYHDKRFFLDQFEHFQTPKSEENLIVQELLEENHKHIHAHFSLEENINRYIEVIKEV